MAWTKAPEDERRRQILDAALRTGARDGLRALTLRAVAAEAGLSHGLVLFHFGSKQALLDALLGAVLAWLGERAGPDGAPQEVADLVAAEVAAADREHVAVLLDFWVLAGADAGVRARMAEAIVRYEADLARAVAGADDAERALLAGLATTVVFGEALRALLGEDPASAGERLRAALRRP